MEVGTSYTFSIDIGRISTTGYQYSGACYFYMYHDSLLTTNLITSSVGTMTTTGTIQWKTYSGTYAPTASSFEFGMYYACPYTSYYLAKTYVDNVVITGKVISPRMPVVLERGFPLPPFFLSFLFFFFSRVFVCPLFAAKGLVVGI